MSVLFCNTETIKLVKRPITHHYCSGVNRCTCSLGGLNTQLFPSDVTLTFGTVSCPPLTCTLIPVPPLQWGHFRCPTIEQFYAAFHNLKHRIPLDARNKLSQNAYNIIKRNFVPTIVLRITVFNKGV